MKKTQTQIVARGLCKLRGWHAETWERWDQARLNEDFCDDCGCPFTYQQEYSLRAKTADYPELRWPA